METIVGTYWKSKVGDVICLIVSNEFDMPIYITNHSGKLFVSIFSFEQWINNKTRWVKL